MIDFLKFSIFDSREFTYVFFLSVCSVSSAKWSKLCFSLSQTNEISFICVIRLMLQCVLNVIWALYFFSLLLLQLTSVEFVCLFVVWLCVCVWNENVLKKFSSTIIFNAFAQTFCLFHNDSTALEKPCIALALCEFEVRSYAKKKNLTTQFNWQMR